MPQLIKLPDGGTASFPDGMPTSEIEGVLRAQFPPPASEMSAGESITGGLGWGAIADTVGLGRKEARTPAGVVLNPQTGLEHAASAAVTAYPIFRAGKLASALAPASSLAPVAGRLLGTGALGGAEGAYKGESVLGSAAKDMGAAGVMETVLGGAGRLASIPGKLRDTLTGAVTTATNAARGAAPVTESLAQAVAGLGPRYAGATVKLPSLGGAPLAAKDAAAQIDALGGTAYQMARNELIAALSMVDKARVAPAGVGEMLKGGTAATRPAAAPAAKPGALDNNKLRSLADAAVAQNPEMAIGAGMMGAAHLPFSSVAARVLPMAH